MGCHVVAMPYPGRGHINPMMNLCNLLVSRKDNILISFVVTEEWLGFLSSETKPAQIRYATIPNVIPSEIGRGADFANFVEATRTKLEDPFERLLNRLEPPRPSIIIYDISLPWAVGVGERWTIPVAALWTLPASVFSVYHHFDLLLQNGHFPANVSERGNEVVNYIPGIPPTRIADLPTIFYGALRNVLHLALEAISMVPNAQYFLLTSIYELESHTIDTLKQTIPIPIYSIGPAIPYFKLGDNENLSNNFYMQWLDSQPKASVLYISQGSFLSVSAAQMDEIIAGVHDSGIRIFWVARDEASRIKEAGCGDNGLVVSWCDQLNVLCHPSVGGFWSHCGWNSIKDGIFAGLPFLTYPIFLDQVLNSKTVVEDWNIGCIISWRSKKQSLTARSSTEAEYRALADTTQELLWLRWLLADMGVTPSGATALFCDNHSALQIAHNDVFHDRTKHIEIDCHFIRQHVTHGTVHLHPISSVDQPADIFTKAHSTGRFVDLVSKLKLVDVCPP